MQVSLLSLLSLSLVSVVSASACQSGASGLAKPADLLKMADNCQISEMSESISDAAACNAAHMKELKADFQAKASKMHLKGRRSNKAQDELKQLDTEFGKSVDAMTKLNHEINEALISLNKKIGASLKENEKNATASGASLKQGEKNVTASMSKAITKGEEEQKKVSGDIKKGSEKLSSDIKNGTEAAKHKIEKEQKKASEHNKKIAESFKTEESKEKAQGIKAMTKACKAFKYTDINDIENEFKHFGKSVETSFKDFKPFAAYFNSTKAAMESFEKSMNSVNSQAKAFSSKMECDLKTFSKAGETLIKDIMSMASTKVSGSPASSLEQIAKAVL